MKTRMVEPTDPISLNDVFHYSLDVTGCAQVTVSADLSVPNGMIYVRLDSEPTNEAETIADLKPCAKFTNYGNSVIRPNPFAEKQYLHFLIISSVGTKINGGVPDRLLVMKEVI